MSRRRRILKKKKIDAILIKRTEAEMRHIYLAAHPMARGESGDRE
jgi:hypothetical protein